MSDIRCRDVGYTSSKVLSIWIFSIVQLVRYMIYIIYMIYFLSRGFYRTGTLKKNWRSSSEYTRALIFLFWICSARQIAQWLVAPGCLAISRGNGTHSQKLFQKKNQCPSIFFLFWKSHSSRPWHTFSIVLHIGTLCSKYSDFEQ